MIGFLRDHNYLDSIYVVVFFLKINKKSYLLFKCIRRFVHAGRLTCKKNEYRHRLSVERIGMAANDSFCYYPRSVASMQIVHVPLHQTVQLHCSMKSGLREYVRIYRDIIHRDTIAEINRFRGRLNLLFSTYH